MKMQTTRMTAVLAGTALLALAGCSSSSDEGGGDASDKPITIKVVYFIQGTPNPMDGVMEQVKSQYEVANPGVTVDLQPMKSSSEDYFVKLALMNKSASTAPDVIYEDSFQVKSDAAAGYLAPLDDYLADWSDWDKFVDAAKGAGQGVDGKTYSVSLGTDTQGIWYNKDVFAKAGLPVPFAPTSWDDLLAAARQIKKNVPDVYPWEIYAGIQLAEIGTVRGFQTFLTGTDDSLFDDKTGKWVVDSQGFEDTLNLIDTVYSEGLAPEPSVALDPALSQTTATTWLPEGKLGMIIDGSWLPSFWAETGLTPWPEWPDTLGWAAIPTQDGQAPGSTSMSGGWTIAMGAKTNHPAEAFGFLSTLLSQENALKYAIDLSQIAVRSDVSEDPDFQASNPSFGFFSKIVEYTHFRPATSDYGKISNEITVAMEAVMTGQQSPKEAAATYDKALAGIVGDDNTMSAK